MVILLFVCNFSWAAEHGVSDDRLNDSGFIDPGDHGTVLSNIPSICELIQSIISNQMQNSDLAELLLNDPQPIIYSFRVSFPNQNISSASIAINAP